MFGNYGADNGGSWLSWLAASFIDPVGSGAKDANAILKYYDRQPQTVNLPGTTFTDSDFAQFEQEVVMRDYEARLAAAQAQRTGGAATAPGYLPGPGAPAVQDQKLSNTASSKALPIIISGTVGLVLLVTVLRASR